VFKAVFLILIWSGVFAQGEGAGFQKVSTISIPLDSLHGIDFSNVYCIKRNGKPCLVVFDAKQSKLRFIDLKAGKNESAIDLSKIASQFRVDGFSYVNDDSIFLYNYGKSIMQLVNAKGVSYGEYTVGKEALIDTIQNRYYFYPWPRVSSLNPIVKYGQRIFLVGSVSGESAYDFSENRPVLTTLDLNNQKLAHWVPYLRSYAAANFGGMELRDVYSTSDGHKLYFSFPISDTLVAFNLSTSQTSFIVPTPQSNFVARSINVNKGVCVSPDVLRKLYDSSGAFEALHFDQYRKVFYRFFKHGIEEKAVKPISIIGYGGYTIQVYDMDFRLLGTSERLFGYLPSISYIDENGLHVLRVSVGEPLILFDCFRFRE
jgi:hypothetical protein